MRFEWLKQANKYYSEILDRGYLCVGNIHECELEKTIEQLRNMKKDKQITYYDINTGEKIDYLIQGSLDVISREQAFERTGSLIKNYSALFVRDIFDLNLENN